MPLRLCLTWIWRCRRVINIASLRGRSRPNSCAAQRSALHGTLSSAGGGHSTISQLKPAMRSEPVNRGHGGLHGYVLGMDTADGNVAVAEDP